MRRRLSPFALMLMLASGLYGDWKIVSRAGERTRTEYFKGSLMRTDPVPGYTTVLNYEKRSQVNWRSDLREYMVVEWPPQPAHDSADGPVIVVERNTTDTGERKAFFGHMARHMTTRTKRSDGPDSFTDGWYIDAPGLPSWKNGGGHSIAVLTLSAGGQKPVMPRIELKHTGPASTGLAVWEKVTVTTTLPGGVFHTTDTLSEVVDLVEGPLPDRLFERPDGYQEVTSLPMAARDGWWQRIEDWFSSLFATTQK